MKWIKLEDELPDPKEHYCVLLFPLKTDCGVLYITSNPEYVRKNAIKDGYTHWAAIELNPDHDKWIEWQKSIRYVEENLNKLFGA